MEKDTSERALRHDQIFGYNQPVENWGFETFISYVLPEDRPQVEEKFRVAASTGASWHLECRIRRANDGEVRWIAASGEPQVAPDGQVTKIFGLVGDITDRKRWEEHQQLLINELKMGRRSMPAICRIYLPSSSICSLPDHTVVNLSFLASSLYLQRNQHSRRTHAFSSR